MQIPIIKKPTSEKICKLITRIDKKIQKIQKDKKRIKIQSNIIEKLIVLKDKQLAELNSRCIAGGANENFISFLNELLMLDPEFVSTIMTTRFKCNAAIANHPYVQVKTDGNQYICGLVGILNGLLGRHNGICFLYDKVDSNIVRAFAKINKISINEKDIPKDE